MQKAMTDSSATMIAPSSVEILPAEGTEAIAVAADPSQTGGKKKRGPKKGGKKGGRKKGVLNVATGEFKEFCKKLITDMTFRSNITRRFRDGTLDPSLMKLLILYGAGRPPERIEVSGPDGGPIRSLISFYIPSNGRALRQGEDRQAV